ncbi:AEC family transporter [Streptococcus minor]|nr:AEC family transporter [Streptococcus minor]
MGEILIRALGFIAIIALGYFLKLKRIVKREDAKVLSAIVMNVTLPAALLTSASEVQLDSGIVIPLVLGFAMNLVMDWVGYWEARN